MSWRPVTEAGDLLELEFEGLSGTLAGEKGRPGVEYNSELGIYKTDVCLGAIYLFVYYFFHNLHV
jgi:hypothetical protein